MDDQDIEKYIKLFKDKEKFSHAPNFIGVEIININPIVEKFYNKKPKFTNEEIGKVIEEITIQNGIDNTELSKEVKKFILHNFNLQQFFENIKEIMK